MKRRLFLSGACLAVLGGAAWADPARRPLRRPAPAPAVRLASARLGAAELGFLALDLRTGAVRAAHQPDLPLPPASTLKIVTALYALDRLGAGHRFATRVLRAGDALVLAGGGDPLLDTDALADLARDTATAAAGWRPARFLVWGGALPRIAELAPGQAPHLAYNPTLSGMMLNFNRVHLGWRCAERCDFSLEARAARHSPRAYSVQAALRPGSGFGHAVAGGVEHWQVPRAGLGKAGSRWLPVRQPEIYAGDVFQTLCRAEGLALPAPEVTGHLPEGVELARHDSPELTEILQGMLEYSTNLTAEAVGLAASGAGSLRESAEEMTRWVRAREVGGAAVVPDGGTGGLQGRASGRSGGEADAISAEQTPATAATKSVPHDGTATADAETGSALRFLDHSGLSGENGITARALAGLLARPETRDVLSVILKPDPLRDVLGKAARGDGKGGAPLVRAKTGTLNFVSCLAGYGWAGEPGSEGIAFAILAADPARRAAHEGAELPEGSLAWVKRAKEMQRDLVEAALADTPGPGDPRPLPPEI